MRRRTQALWALAYLGVTLVPLGIILIGPWIPRRGFWIESERFDIESSSAFGPRQQTVRRAVMALAVVMVIAAAFFAM